MNDIAILILAAGRSARMGGVDKLMEPVAGVPLLRRTAQIALAARAGPVWAVLPPKQPGPDLRRAALSGLDVHICRAVDPARGLSHSLQVGIAALPACTPAVMILLADLPALESTDLNKVLIAVQRGGPAEVWRGATQDGLPGHPIVFAASRFAAINALVGDKGAQDLARDAQLVPLAGQRARWDLDTPEDWRRWRAQEGA